MVEKGGKKDEHFFSILYDNFADWANFLLTVVSSDSHYVYILTSSSLVLMNLSYWIYNEIWHWYNKYQTDFDLVRLLNLGLRYK